MIRKENIKVYAVLALLLYLVVKLLSLAFTVLLRPLRWLVKLLFLAFVILMFLSYTSKKPKRSA